jgi:hypothetical protein
VIRGRVHPAALQGAYALQAAGYRVPSLYRPGPASGGHARGVAIDVADMVYHHGGYDVSGARAVHGVLARAVPGSKWAVIAEDDHYHAELSSRGDFIGRKNAQSSHQLQVQPMSSRYTNLDYGAEHGDPVDTGAALVRGDAVHRIAATIQHENRDQNIISKANNEAPALIEKAQKVAMIREMTSPPVKWVDVKNGRVIASSLGAGALMRPSDVRALIVDIANGMPVFEPQIFPFAPAGPDTFEFFPSFALEVGVGGPLPAGELFKWVASHIRITSSVLNANPGIQAQMVIQFAPTTIPGSQQTFLFELGDGTIPVILSPVHGALAGGLPRLQTRQLAVQAGVPIAGVDFPRVAILGLPTADYQIAYRFMVPGDMPTDRFSAYMV